MTISTYAELQTAIKDWMKRQGLASGKVQDFITLAEAKLNRKIPAVLTDATLTGTLDIRRISISSNSCVEALALFLVDSSGNETELTKKTDGTFSYSGSSGTPRFWAIEGTNIDFDCPLNATSLSFRLHFKQRFALSDSATTNWLLTNHPDLYLSAAIVWGGIFTSDDQRIATHAAMLEEGIAEVRREIGRQNRGTLSVDAALVTPSTFGYQDWLAG